MPLHVTFNRKQIDTFNFEYIYLKNRKEKAVIDYKLSFDNHVKKICRKTCQNIKLFKLKTKRSYF